MFLIEFQRIVNEFNKCMAKKNISCPECRPEKKNSRSRNYRKYPVEIVDFNIIYLNLSKFI